MGFSTHLRCDQLVELASDYLEHTLTMEDAERLEQHLLICSACALYVAQIRAVRTGAGRLVHESEAPLDSDSELRLRALLKRFKDGGAP